MGTLEEEPGEDSEFRIQDSGREAAKDKETRRQGEGETGEKNEDKSSIPNPQSSIVNPHSPTVNRQWSIRRLFVVGLVIVGAVLGLPPLFTWQRTSEQRARSLSNMRRLADAWQLYAQDWDGSPVVPIEQRAEGLWLTWPRRLGAYGVKSDFLDNPANSLTNLTGGARDVTHNFPVEAGYALNHRFWNTFAPGPFPVDNLELSAQTVLFVEAGPLSAAPLRAPHDAQESKGLAALEYGDMTDRIAGLVPYPSTHDGKMAVVAADGHATTVHVEHYAAKDGPHDPSYGRIGGDIYNWNGGHPNGDVDHPPFE